MNKPVVIFLSFLLAAVILKLAVEPYVQRRSAVRAVESVLKNWAAGDPLAAMDYWKDPEESPPVYNITSYNIIKKEFSKENTTDHARIHVNIEFAAGSLLPSGREWVFVVERSKYGWKIADFFPTSKN